MHLSRRRRSLQRSARRTRLSRRNLLLSPLPPKSRPTPRTKSRASRSVARRRSYRTPYAGPDINLRFIQNIIDELTRDNAATATQLAVFRTEKDQLLSETEDLKQVSLPLRCPLRCGLVLMLCIEQSVKALELTLEESILTEEAKLADDLKVSEGGASGLPTSASQDVVKLQQALIEAQIALESQQERHEVGAHSCDHGPLSHR